MPQREPWHSANPTDQKVHHDNTECVEGENIQPKLRRFGTGNLPRCRHCTYLDAQGR